MTTTPPRREMVLSVVTPAYNQAAYLRDTIESVLSQDYPHIEYRVIDDGSTDRTPEVLADYSGRLQWETQTNCGQTPTINRGWEQARGDVLTWLNSDDTFLPGAVSTAMTYLERHPDVGIVYGRTLFTRADGTPIEESKAWPAFDYADFVVGCENPIPQPSAFIRRSVIDDVGLLDPHYYYFMDWDFWLRAGARHRIASIPDVLSTYRLHPESKTVSQSLKAAPELERMYRMFFAGDRVPEEVLRRKRRAMTNMRFTSGGYYLKGGDGKAAARMAFQAVAEDPALLACPSTFHKFVYCLSAHSPLYALARGIVRRARPVPETGSSGALAVGRGGA